ncbi:MAG TPA: tail fiber domain-containing protein, partial [Panacibacter sp.]|nr:tail fiber domain-containing protein [Panacibacter sp.]
MRTKIQHNKKTFALAAMCICLGGQLMAQAWSVNGNAGIAAGTNYLGTSDPNDLVFRSNAIERGRVFGAGGAWRFGTATNYASIDSIGRLTFTGKGVYQVGGNKYAFQFSGNPNLGLYFNSSLTQFEFRDAGGLPAFTLAPATGAGTFKGALTVGAYTLPSIDGTSGQVLKTNGAGALAWSADDNNNGWGLTGNAGTSSATNFIGTTDAVALVTRTNNVERMRLLTDGKLGIGTNSPNSRLHINSASGEDALRVNINGNTRFLVNDAGGVTIGSTTEAPANSLYVSGDVGIGNSAPVNKLDVTGSIGVTGSLISSGSGTGVTFKDGQYLRDNAINTSLELEMHADFLPDNDISHSIGSSTQRWTDVWAQDGTINTSDARDKKNIRDMDYGLKQIMQLRSVKFNWKDAESGDKLGVIAQEIQKVLPEVVRDYEIKRDEATGKTKKVPSARLGVMYADIIPVLIRGMQEQQKMIEDQNKKIEDLTKLVTQSIQQQTAADGSTG